MNTWIKEYKKENEEIQEKLEKKSHKISNWRGILFLGFVIFLVVAFNSELVVYKIISALFILAFFVVANRHKKVINEKTQAEDYINIIGEYESKIDGKWENFDGDGSEFLDEAKIFMQDLQIIGKNSLFQFLNTAKSVGGKKKLFKALSADKIDKETIKNRQDAVEDISSQINFNLEFQSSLKKIKDVGETDFKKYFHIFEGTINFSMLEFASSIILSAFTLVSLILGIVGIMDLAFFEVLFIVQLLSSFLYMKFQQDNFNMISESVKVLSKVNNTYKTVEKTDFTSEMTKGLKNDVSKGKEVLKKIIFMDNLDSLRKNFFSYVFFNVFFSLNRIIMYKYSKLLKEDNSGFRDSINAIEEFEMLISLASMNLIKDKITKAEISESLEIECKDLIYPLLSENVCIANDFKCKEDINIITGSNMSGKTSFMRAIGVNMVLAYSGAFVNAEKFKIPMTKIFTSINVKDDINKGISTFYGELLRIRDMMEFAENSSETMLVFIDEIFKGTNYADRIFGAKKVLEKLSKINCIVFLTTHDFELCEVDISKIKNYHFFEEYVEGKMVFNHKINDGKCQSTNAKELMKEIGIV